MMGLRLAEPGRRLSVLCLGAHSDDIEIGAGGSLLHWQASGVEFSVLWCVLSAVGPRREEASASAADFLKGVAQPKVELQGFSDGFFPAERGAIKQWFETLKGRIAPDLILTHRRGDAHQDHRLVNELTWNTFRDHLILEYEIPKWDGDLGQPNLYQPISRAAMRLKADLLMRHFGTQRSKHWFDAEIFSGLARLRGMQCRAPENYAEGFFAHKMALI